MQAMKAIRDKVSRHLLVVCILGLGIISSLITGCSVTGETEAIPEKTLPTTESALTETEVTSSTPETSVPATDSPTSTSAQPAPEVEETKVMPTPTAIGERNYIVVDTGQVECYDNSRIISCPDHEMPFYGQDAQIQGIQPAYEDNGDGSITDLNTGLMWQKDPGEKMTYEEAVANASSFNLAGYDDWRLPNIKELYSLILFSGTDPPPERVVKNAVPFIDTDYFDFEYGDTGAGERIIDAQYWSAMEYVSTTMNSAATIFGVNFADGRIKGYPRDIGRRRGPVTKFVRYVRGNPDYGINLFTNNGDGTITDDATGLMWARDDSGEGMDWESTLAWVQEKNRENYLGYTDWRLPNAKELQSIVDYTRSRRTTDSAAIAPIFNTTAIIDERGETNYPFYWTGTTHVNALLGGSSAVYVSFGEALGFMFNSWIDVHGAGAQRSDPKSGNPNDYPLGRGPQGDAIRIYNYVRCVRNVGG
ncbi:DUF1566 domain-containing protein [Chloroflexota bacterium]